MITSELQKLSVPAIVTLYELDASNIGAGVIRWHGEANYGEGADVKKAIVWAGDTYSPVTIQSTGLEMRSDGKPSTPTLTIANTVNGRPGAITDLCAYNGDFVGAQLRVIRVMAKHLDAVNFAAGNPSANATQFTAQYWNIEQKTQETPHEVAFELATPLTAQRKRIPARNITRYCDWALKGKYRGESCGYTGAAKFTKDGTPTTDPAQDKCGGRLKDCKLRFGQNNPLGFGGFPGSTWRA